MIYDISPAINFDLSVWPGDISLSRQLLFDINSGDNLTLSTLHSTVHIGAHADAPNHFCADAPAIGECNLENYLGNCQVITIHVARSSVITPSDINVPIYAERILFRTKTFPDPNNWNVDFAALSPELIDSLKKYPIKLIGIDTPSVDLFHSKELNTHKRLFANNMAILEGLILDDVPDGIYELIALPLKLMHFDASPVRAILRTI